MATPSFEEVSRVFSASSHVNTVVPVYKEWPLTDFPSLGPEEVYLAISKGNQGRKFANDTSRCKLYVI